MLPFFTIGHSNRSIEAFLALLRESEIEFVADVRAIPTSRANPQFNADALVGALAAHSTSYEHMPALGGLRGKTPGLLPELNGLWTNASFHNYADYALTAPFHAGLEHLLAVGHRLRCTVMCSEAVWWRCHRRIIADHLLAHGEAVFHVMAPGHLVPARLTAGALVESDGTVRYPLPPDGRSRGGAAG